MEEEVVVEDNEIVEAEIIESEEEDDIYDVGLYAFDTWGMLNPNGGSLLANSKGITNPKGNLADDVLLPLAVFINLLTKFQEKYENAWNIKEIKQRFKVLLEQKRKEGKSSTAIAEEIRKIHGKNYYITLNWQDEEQQSLDPENPVFFMRVSSSNAKENEEKLSIENILLPFSPAWDGLMQYAYAQWILYYITLLAKLSLNDPYLLTFAPVSLPAFYIFLKLGKAIKEKLINPYSHSPDLVKRELIVEKLKTQYESATMLSTAAEVRLMENYLLADYHHQWKKKFSQRMHKNSFHIHQKLFQQKPIDAEKENIFIVENEINPLKIKKPIAAYTSSFEAEFKNSPPYTDKLLATSSKTVSEKKIWATEIGKKFWSTESHFILALITAFFTGMFTWYINGIFNSQAVAGIFANYGLGAIGYGLAVATVATTSFALGIGVLAGIYYAYKKYKQLKKRNKKMLYGIDKENLKQKQNMIDIKIDKLMEKKRENIAHAPESTPDNLEAIEKYKVIKNERELLIANREAFREKYSKLKLLRKQALQLREYINDSNEKIKKNRETIEDLEKAQKTLNKKYTHAGNKLLNPAIIKQYDQLSCQIKTLEIKNEKLAHQCDKARKLLSSKASEIGTLYISLNYNEEYSFYDRFRDFIMRHERLSFLVFFLEDGDKFATLVRDIKTAEEKTAIQQYKTYQEKEDKLQAKITRQQQKKIEWNRRHAAYTSLNEKLEEAENVRKEIYELNKQYENYVTNINAQIDTQIKLNSLEKKNLEKLRKEVLCEKLKQPKLPSIDYLLLHSGEKPNDKLTFKKGFKHFAKILLSKLSKAWHRLLELIEQATSGVYLAKTIGWLITSAAVVAGAVLVLGPAGIGAACGMVALGLLVKYFYEKHQEKQAALTDAYLEKTQFTKSILHNHTQSLEEIKNQYTERNHLLRELEIQLNTENAELEKNHEAVLKANPQKILKQENSIFNNIFSFFCGSSATLSRSRDTAVSLVENEEYPSLTSHGVPKENILVRGGVKVIFS